MRFPLTQQLHIAADGRTLYVTNVVSGTLQVLDLARILPDSSRDGAPQP